MAHELEGNKFVGTRPAWHNIGTIVSKAMTSEEAMSIANLDTFNDFMPIYAQNGDEYIRVRDHRAVVRLDDAKVLGIVGTDYRIINNRDCFAFMDSIIGEGRAVYETAGSLRGGTRLFLTVKLPGNAQVGPDKIDKYLCLSTSHDGSLALRAQWTPVRVVCANTLSVALRGFEMRANGIVIHHTQNHKAKVAEARHLLGLTEEYYRYMEESFNRMLDEHMSTDQFKDVVSDLLPIPEDNKDHSRTIKKRDRIVQLFDLGIGHKDIAGTRWAAFNAVTQYADHDQTFRASGENSEDDARMESIMWGTGSTLRQKAYNALAVD